MIKLAEFDKRQAALNAERALLSGGHPGEIIGPYVYAMFCRPKVTLEPLPVAPGHPVYIGKADGRTPRDHLLYRSSSQSAPRRTLGALLKHQLGLVAFPRGRAMTRRDIAHFNFGDGEPRLTAWMRANLIITCVGVPSPARAIEKALIFKLEPPINLTDWPNPFLPAIREMKRGCREEAETRRGDRR